MLLVVVLCSALVLKLSGIDEVPKWWPSDSEATTPDQAVQLENTMTTQLTAVRQQDEQRWSVAFSANEINGWLAHRLEPTVKTHQGDDAWPSDLRSVRAAIDKDMLMIGAMVEHDSGHSYLWFRCTLEVQGDEIVVGMKNPRIGDTQMPMRVVNTILKDESSLRFRASLDLEDGRIARVVALRILDGRIELVLETVINQTP
jgi:hypothetical protein